MLIAACSTAKWVHREVCFIVDLARTQVFALFFRDNFEDELRAFEGGADGLLLCVWDYEVPAFSQVSVTLAVVSKWILNGGMFLRLIFAISGFHCSYKLYGGLLDAHPGMKLSNLLCNIVFPFTRQYTRQLKDQLLESGVNLVGVGWQPLSLATVLVDDMLLCFGNIFATQVRTLVLLTNVLDCATLFWPICRWFMSSLCIVTMTWLPLASILLRVGNFFGSLKETSCSCLSSWQTKLVEENKFGELHLCPMCASPCLGALRYELLVGMIQKKFWPTVYRMLEGKSS